jgi:beta-galactosidase beta subunit
LEVVFSRRPWKEDISFVQELNENSPDTDMEQLCGDKIKARVMSYETKDPKEAIFEAHRR